ncbi:penicillin-binding protein [Corynebacterium sp. P7202]|uniref:Transglycosylase domain-containing protein n=1 Tax=Corynebacterium pygosceleis TaxID=2800406 RepID=A0A9Q4GJH4_9CORY|nr:transglycosylase domain-containing protein [Corynebacterium pygosceleis]MCK7637157.1 penicillin-binding protein [Corynebacterium pygosceleis]MCX7445060.1 transglycosylase domain-containing protein [Corynebacterium pygosceleis]MCX7469428.1 transglycosylase domain-containing protein [Corynebacterium pygosceleis]
MTRNNRYDNNDGDGVETLHAPRRRRWILWSLAVAFVLFIVVPVGVAVAAYVTADVPEPEELVNKQVSNIYASDSTTELARIVPPEGNREQVNLDQIPESLRGAVLAAEDREFYTNPGFSVTGFARAVKGQITGDDSAGGGSTITQQYVKNAVVGNERSYERKLKELVISAKMANEWSKNDVLEAYLNTIYFGRNSYGVAAASEAYFGKPLAELVPAESAVLAASIQRPSQLDPWTNRAEAEQRWNYVLDGMVATGYLSQAERDAAVYPEVVDPALNQAYVEATGANGLIKNQVVAELEQIGITQEDLDTRGLRITTTIDIRNQNAAVDSVSRIFQGEDEKLRSAVVSIEPSNGAVRAYYGGDDAAGWDYANAPIQTGSTFKIYGLAAALQQGIPLATMYSSAPVTTGNVTVTNVGGNGCGYCTIAEALKRSHNTSFIRLEQDLENGSQDVADMAHALGMARSLPGYPSTLTENGGQPYEGIILGQYESRPFDQAIALATLSNEGVWHEPYFVEKVTTAENEVLYEHTPTTGQRRVSANVANNLMSAMAPIAAWSNQNQLAGGRESASKTGTTQLGDTGFNKDAWMIGSTPQLATAVWVGTVDNTPLLNYWGGNMYGSGLPAQIWKSTMDQSLEGKPFESFPAPQPLGFNNAPAPQYVPPAPGSTSRPVEEDPETEDPEGEPGEEEGAIEGGVPEIPGVPAPPPPPEQVEILPGISIPNIFN